MAALLVTRAQPAPDSGDPLLAAVNHFIFSGDAYDGLPEDMSEEEDAEAFERLCNEPDRILATWSTPAATREGALAAFRLVLQIGEENDAEPIMLNLMKQALLPYLEERCL